MGKGGVKMRSFTGSVIFCFLFFAACAIITPLHAAEQDKRWVRFAYDKEASGTEYYYDAETVQYLSNNRASVWMKVLSSGSEDMLHMEIECSGTMFRTIRPYESFFSRSSSTSYVEYGWVEIPPDSEVHQLKKRVCRPK
jgi:hypothetical protein